MKCEHDIKHTNCTHYNENCYSTRICIKYSDFECKLCKKENTMTNKEAIEIMGLYKIAADETDCKQALNMAIKALTDVPTCKENKPLTIAELEQMDGQPVWIDCTMCQTKRWGIMNVEKNSIEWAGGGMHIITEGNFYKEKPSPRMVTIETAIEEKLMIRYLITDEFKPALECLQFTIEKYGLPKEVWVMACWEAEGWVHINA